VHSLTGAAGTFGMHSLSAVAHELEQHLAAMLQDEQESGSARWQQAIDVLERLERLTQVRLQQNAPSLKQPHYSVAQGSPLIDVVEDDADLHQVIRAMVGGCYDFELATTLADAHAMIALEWFDVVILDLGLPDGSGWDLLPLLEKQEPTPRIIILSGTELSSAEAGKVEAALLKSRVSSHELLDAINTSINPSKPGGKKP